MIEWINYDPINPPQDGVEYLVSDGDRVDVAYMYEFQGFEWHVPDNSHIDGSRAVTHYAHINLPREDTND